MKKNQQIKLAGWSGLCIDTCPSTNLLLKEWITAGTQTPPCFLIAENQTSGRGRLCRTWVAPAGNMNLSLGIKLPMNTAKIYQVNLVAACSLHKAVIEFTGLPVQIKWPNDLVLNHLKIAGILSESLFEHSAIVIGVGVNLNSLCSDFPTELRAKVTTVRQETAVWIDQQGFLEGFLDFFAKDFSSYLQQGFKSFEDKINTVLAWRNQQVRVQESDEVMYEGVLLGLDSDGFLLVGTATGTKKVLAGDISCSSP